MLLQSWESLETMFNKHSIDKHLLKACLAAVFAIGLTACSSSDSGTQTTTPTTPTTPTEPAPPPGPTAESIKADAADAITDASAAGMAAEQAKMDAIKYAGMIDTASVSGDSAMATANAQKVLNAEMAANQAVMDADDALDAAMESKTAAEALPEDDAGRDSAIAAADEAIKQATAHKKAAMAIVDATETTATGIDSLKGAVAAIRGADMDMPNDAAYHGQQVAMAIGAALGPTSATDGSGLRVTDTATAPPDTIMTAMQKDDHQGMTWAEIVGVDNVIDARIGTTNAGETTPVKAASVADMTLGTTQAATAADGMESDGTQIGGVTYMGIPGTAFCMGDDCRVEEVPDPATPTSNLTDQRKLAGSWYFTPTSPMQYYVKATGATAYSEELNYARFGHWLVVDGTSGEATIHTFAISGNTNTNTAGLDVTTVNTAADATELTDMEATYTGMAVGMSLHKEIDAQGNTVEGSLSSGAFMANVTLTAKFGGSPLLGGMIDGFTSVNGGSNVDSAWSVKLMETAFTNAAVADGTADASGQDGEWNAAGYGPSGGRPIGIYGDFNAHFTDGHAAGAYAVR